MKRVGKGFYGRVTPNNGGAQSRRNGPKRKDTKVPQPSGPTTNVADEAINEEMDDSLVRDATTASSLEVDSGGGPRRQETMGDIIAQTRSENVSKLFNDPLLARVLTLDTIKTTQANEIASLKRRVKKLEKKNKSRTHKFKRLYKVGLSARVESSRDKESLDMFDVDTLTGDEVLAEQVVAAKDVNLSVDEVTLAQALAALKSEKVQEKGDVIKEPSIPVSIPQCS
ncbi:hypothetical protein Tco_1125885 [Tanacetum coccineum]